MYPVKYDPNVVYEKVNKVLYLKVLKSIYGILKSALLSYIKLRKYLDTYSLKYNPYDLCVTNNILE